MGKEKYLLNMEEIFHKNTEKIWKKLDTNDNKIKSNLVIMYTDFLYTNR